MFNQSSGPFGQGGTSSGGGAISGAVASVFGRSGTVLALAGDYTATKITNDSTVAGASVKLALNQLDTDLGVIETALPNYTLLTTTAGLTGNLQAQITADVANLVTANSKISSLITISGNHETRISYLESLSASGTGGHTIQDEGVSLPARTKLNFIGAGVAATDNAGNNSTDITISISGGSGVPYTGATGNVDLGTYSLITDSVRLNTSPSVTPVQGELYWDTTEGTPSVLIDAVNNVTLSLGTEQYVRIVNKTGVQINDGQVVCISGAQGNRPCAILAKADALSTSSVIGIATQNISNNAEGFITINGDVHGFNTTGFSAGDELYLSATSAGTLTNTIPSSPNFAILVATALNSTANGAICVHPRLPIAENTSLGSNRNVAPSQSAVKTYVDTISGGIQTIVNGKKPFNGVVYKSATMGCPAGTFQISGAYDIYSNGVKFSKTNDTVAISADNTLNFVYFNTSGVLTASTSVWDILADTIPVATVYKTGSKYAVGEERHNHTRDRDWHNNAHRTIGTRYESGLTGTFTNTTFSITQGVVWDEDIKLDSLATKTTCRLWYRNAGGASMTFDDAVSLPYKELTGNLAYDNGGTQTAITLNNYGVSWVYMSNDIAYPILIVQGQGDYATVLAAQNATLPVIPGLSAREWKLLYKVIFKRTAGGTTYDSAQDYREASSLPNGSVGSGDHSVLINRDAANQHPESSISFTDITTGNATTSNHGYLPKLGGGTTNFLRADGSWAAPAGGGSSVPPPVRLRVGGETGAALVASAVPVAYYLCPNACTISKWTAATEISGSISIAVWKDITANFPPTVADIISASAPIALSGANYATDTTLTGWTKSISGGDWLAFKCNSGDTTKPVFITMEFA